MPNLKLFSPLGKLVGTDAVSYQRFCVSPPCDTLPEETPEHPELQLEWDSESTWLLSSCDSSDTTTVFGEYLQPSQMTDVLLVAIQALTADDIYDRQMGSNVLEMSMRDPPSWLTDVSALWLDCPAREPCQALFFPPSLTLLSGAPEAISGQQRGMGRAAVSVAAWAMAALQWQHPPHPCPLQVPKIMRSIHINVERIRTEPARHSLVALLLLLTKRCPREAVRSLLKISPTCDRYWPRQP
ncbi:LOW QUALITY PROTEIN: hypothetical protein QYF61_016448 [Mycteria americana]|uniref:Maestro-like HEAT-repeats domain-containing protein n=1 Tax=Mycteria americana TaxID=33587 RepID=A0AAN7N8N2_MYCAM|nr:LOW QUALITY PROTEIN: hypothetical protein QYF61_016448 [Mycteria americana]